MSIPVFKQVVGSTLPMRPRGGMLKGWLPGTIVNFVNSQDGNFLDVDLASNFPHKSSNGGLFTLNGSYELSSQFDRRFANNNESSGFWTPDEYIQYTKNEQNNLIQFDNSHQLQKIGKDITTVNFDGGCFRIYTFQKYDNEYLESNGASGGEINWNQHVGETVGTSPRSLFTSLDNNVIDEVPSYRVGKYSRDENGKQYILIVRR